MSSFARKTKLMVCWRPRRDLNPCYRRERAFWGTLHWFAMVMQNSPFSVNGAWLRGFHACRCLYSFGPKFQLYRYRSVTGLLKPLRSTVAFTVNRSVKGFPQGALLVDLKRVTEIALTVVVAILLLLAAKGRYPYGFYMILQTVGTVCGAYWAVRVHHAGPRGWLWAFLAVALLLNPVLPVRMQRSQWQPVDLWLGILLLGWSGYWDFRKPSGQ